METRVQVKHYRMVPGINTRPRRYFRGFGFKDAGFNGIAPSVMGGRTVAYVDVDGHVYAALAECSMRDQFNYRLGRLIATGRLRKRLEQEGLLDKVVLA